MSDSLVLRIWQQACLSQLSNDDIKIYITNENIQFLPEEAARSTTQETHGRARKPSGQARPLSLYW